MKQDKIDKIKQTKRETQERRKNQSIKTLDVQIDNNHLSKKNKEHLLGLFKEAKWIYNFLLNNDIFSSNIEKSKTIQVFNKKTNLYEERELKYLSSQMKQSIVDRTKQNIYNLSKTKKKTKKFVGKLKFKKYINSIPLKQIDSTFKVLFDENKIRLQGFKKALKVFGLEQFQKYSNYEICGNATLVKIENKFHIYIPVAIPKEIFDENKPHIGIDFGIKDSLTFSNGEKINLFIEPSSKKIRKLQKQLARQEKQHKIKQEKDFQNKNREKVKSKLRLVYQKDKNKREDLAKKVLSYLKNNFSLIVFQDEMIKAWQAGRYGKKISNSSLGYVKQGLKQLPCSLMIERRFASTQICPECGCLTKHPLEQRFFECQGCHFVYMDRDIKASLTLLEEGEIRLALKQNLVWTKSDSKRLWRRDSLLENASHSQAKSFQRSRKLRVSTRSMSPDNAGFVANYIGAGNSSFGPIYIRNHSWIHDTSTYANYYIQTFGTAYSLNSEFHIYMDNCWLNAAGSTQANYFYGLNAPNNINCQYWIRLQSLMCVGAAAGSPTRTAYGINIGNMLRCVIQGSIHAVTSTSAPAATTGTATDSVITSLCRA